MNEIQEVFKLFGSKYLSIYKPNKEQKQVYNNILRCRTKVLGNHLYKCNKCGMKLYSYNSCKDRNCPTCQNYRKEVWIENHYHDILSIKYFHLVLALPSKLQPIFYQNKEITYQILFKATSESILEIYNNNNIKIGITSILHTWNQQGDYHPHIHMIITGGGIKNNKWINIKKLPINIIEKRFKKKIIKYLSNTKLVFYNKYNYLNEKKELNKYLDKLYNIKWICYIKEPYKDIKETYKYLGRYTFKVCISNERITKIDNTYVYFKYRSYKDGTSKIMKLKGEEFIRRYLMHVLPKSFIKIRYYGIMTGRNKNKRLEYLKKITKTEIVRTEKITKIEILNRIIGKDVTICPKCNKGILELIYPDKPPNNKVKKEIKPEV